VKTAIGVVIGIAIGVACRWFDLPVPAPPRLMGAVLVLSLTTGYVVTDRLMDGGEAAMAERSGGPAGVAAAGRAGGDDAGGSDGGQRLE